VELQGAVHWHAQGVSPLGVWGHTHSTELEREVLSRPQPRVNARNIALPQSKLTSIARERLYFASGSTFLQSPTITSTSLSASVTTECGALNVSSYRERQYYLPSYHGEERRSNI
jgi:hypothetical protein